MNKIENKNSENLTKRGRGRPKGSQNKTTALLKDAILKAAENAGNGNMVDYLTSQATANPGPFMSLLGKVLPMQVIGDDENPLRVITRVELVAPGHDDSSD